LFHQTKEAHLWIFLRDQTDSQIDREDEPASIHCANIGKIRGQRVCAVIFYQPTKPAVPCTTAGIYLLGGKCKITCILLLHFSRGYAQAWAVTNCIKLASCQRENYPEAPPNKSLGRSANPHHSLSDLDCSFAASSLSTHLKQPCFVSFLHPPATYV
jgi:hypothetical protein